MRNFERAVIINTLCLAAAAAASVVACSSESTVTPNDEGGIGDEGGSSGQLPDGALPDGQTEPPRACAKNEDCPSGVCNPGTKLCVAASCKDGVKNATETDVDCGADCAKCDQLKKCKVGTDCVTGVCKDVGAGLQCQPATTTDGVKNGNETGIDCGGTANPKCPDGQGCKGREDCTSDYCKALVCTAISAADGVQNGTETDIDCGGAGNGRCNDGLKCIAAADCKSDVCTGAICQVPTPTDGKKNGTETDVDCGGGGANPACAVGLNCLVGGDCTSLGCNDQNKCAAGRSCTNPGGYGASTCGTGGVGGVGAQSWEDCCSRAPVVPATGPTAGQTIMLDKYQVTAGRIRVFLESVGYDVRGFVQGARAAGKIPAIPGNPEGRTVLEADWDMYLPTSFAGNQNADEIADCAQGDTTTATGNICKANTEQAGIYTGIRKHLGGIIFKGNDQTSTGCFVGAPGTHSFRFPDGMQDGAEPAFSQAEYDLRSMQCIPYLVAQAFCVWDGGRLELGQEWVAAWGAGNTVPWAAETTRTPKAQGSGTYSGCRFPSAQDDNYPGAAGGCPAFDPLAQTLEYADYQYSYQYPPVNPPLRSDYLVFISPPGRTKGRGPAGHADLIGNNYGLTSNVVYKADPFAATHGWNASGSWEVHGYGRPATGMSRTSNLLNKYGKLGLRCAYVP